MTVDRCHIGQPGCGPPVALWRLRSGHSVALCRGCLHLWLDNADDNLHLEPDHLWWLDGRPT